MLLAATALAMVNVPDPNVTLPPVVPPPDREAMLTLTLFRLSVVLAAFASVTAVALGNALAIPSVTVPALMVVAPV